MSDPNVYTVGWICALATESLAAWTMLDEEHEEVEGIATNDNNSYILGRIGRHNVVIAELPRGEYGTSSAASVAKDMVRSFPNIRVGMMVGVGGGAPSEKSNIRLGDVVVSSPEGGEGGVFQYDFGEEKQGQSYEITGFLNQPPTVLRTAVTALTRMHKRDGHKIGQIIDEVLGKWPRLRREYQRPDVASDVLYDPDWVHAGGLKCAEGCDKDPSHRVKRKDRSEDDDDPTIHYGLIASANTLMKNAERRDELARDKGVLCFEMEAAGLMNHFPCLVVRGICDYSDSHKNKSWQGYAAMTAAAYAKELLGKVAPRQVENERKLADIMSSVDSNIKKLDTTVQQVQTQVHESSVQRQREMIRKWLRPSDPSVNLGKALGQKHQGSGTWLLQHDTFLQWTTGQRPCIWLHGIPGCGKTVLSSTAIESLRTNIHVECLLYFYFDFNDEEKQKLEDLLRCLIYQLSARQDKCFTQLVALSSSHNDGTRQLSCDELRNCLAGLLQEVKKVHIVIDALDESPSRKNQNTGTLAWIGEVLSEHTKIQLLLTSRPEYDITTVMSRLIEADSIISIQIELVKGDIQAYVRSRVRNSVELQRWQKRPDIQDEIETSVLRGSDCMFRLVACQLDAVTSCRDPMTLRNALARLPKDLSEVYNRILRSIPPEDLRPALVILRLVLFSPRPLTMAELVDAVAVQTDGEPHFNPRDRMPDPTEIAVYCSSLTVVIKRDDRLSDEVGAFNDRDSSDDDDLYHYPDYFDDDNRSPEPVLQLAHFSVQEYLLSEQVDSSLRETFAEEPSRVSLSEICLCYLLQLQQDIPAETIRRMFPFAQYCAENWFVHAAVERRQPDRVTGLAMRFLLDGGQAYLNWFRLYDLERPWKRTGNEAGEPSFTALYYASMAGLFWEVVSLLENGADINAQGGCFGSPLQAAATKGYENIVAVLLDKGVDVNAQGGDDCGRALQAASGEGHNKIVTILSTNGADVNAYSEGLYGGSALYAASYKGYDGIVAMLVDKGADVNAQGGQCGHALQAASREGHDKIVTMLVDKGADVNAQGGYFGTALQAASSMGFDKIVAILLDKGVDVNAQGGLFGSALQAASRGGHNKTVAILLDKGADVNAQSWHFGTALQAAETSFHKNEEVVRLLLEYGAERNG